MILNYITLLFYHHPIITDTMGIIAFFCFCWLVLYGLYKFCCFIVWILLRQDEIERRKMLEYLDYLEYERYKRDPELYEGYSDIEEEDNEEDYETSYFLKTHKINEINEINEINGEEALEIFDINF